MRAKHAHAGTAAAAFAMAFLVADTRPTAAHGAGHTVVDRLVPGEAMAVEFSLSSGEPLAGTAFKVFGPGDITIAFQEGRTDRFGRAAFLPDRAGTWRVELADDRGHTGLATVNVGTEQVAPPDAVWRRGLLRISLLAEAVEKVWVASGFGA